MLAHTFIWNDWLFLLTEKISGLLLGAIQVRNAVGGGKVSDFPEKSVTKMYGSTLLALRGGG